MDTLLQYEQKNSKTIILADVISAVLLILFLYTALSKLSGYESFKFTLSRSPLLLPVAGIIAWLIPVAELMVVVFLFIPTLRVKALYASFVLISLFTAYLLYMIAFTPDLPCACGGVLKMLTWKQHIFFNLLFILLSLCGIFLYNRNKNRRSSPPP